ncbi:glutathione S-transferase [Xylogone sp. PMI_703]|nr:glutathione S-transferase [Xylogone sp. PMI_703]
MILTLIGNLKSLCTLKVLLTLAERGITEYKFVDINLDKGEQKLPSHLNKQPFGVVPVLQDGDFTLYESRAICRYLSTKYKEHGQPLLPDLSDLKTMGRFEQWASVEMNNFDALARPLQMELIFKPRAGISKNGLLVESLVNTLSQRLDVFESTVLSRQSYMAGDTFSLIDIFYMPLMAYSFRMGYEELVNSRPNVKTWWETVSSRQSWKQFGPQAMVS